METLLIQVSENIFVEDIFVSLAKFKYFIKDWVEGLTNWVSPKMGNISVDESRAPPTLGIGIRESIMISDRPFG